MSSMHSICVRMAALSDEQKQQVVDMVKEKLKTNGGQAEGGAVNDGAAGPTVMNQESEPEEPAAEEPAEEPVAEEPVAEEPVAEEPVAEEPVAEEPVAEEPVAEEPVTEEEEPAEEPESSGDIVGVVDDLSTELKGMSSDGNVSVGDITGLLDNMMQMVSLLVQTKSKQASESIVAKVALRELMIDRVARDSIGRIREH